LAFQACSLCSHINTRENAHAHTWMHIATQACSSMQQQLHTSQQHNVRQGATADSSTSAALRKERQWKKTPKRCDRSGGWGWLGKPSLWLPPINRRSIPCAGCVGMYSPAGPTNHMRNGCKRTNNSECRAWMHSERCTFHAVLSQRTRVCVRAGVYCQPCKPHLQTAKKYKKIRLPRKWGVAYMWYIRGPRANTELLAHAPALTRCSSQSSASLPLKSVVCCTSRTITSSQP